MSGTGNRHLTTDNCFLIAARDQPPRAAVMRHRLNVVRRQRGFPAHGARAMKRSVCCALLRLGWCADLGGRSRVPASSRTVRALANAHFICLNRLRRSWVRCFLPRCLSTAPKKKDPRPLPGASDHLASLQWFICNLESGTPQPVPRLRDRMQQPRIAHKNENGFRCAYRVQHPQLLCKSRGKTRHYSSATKSFWAVSTCVNQFVTTTKARFRLCSRSWQYP